MDQKRAKNSVFVHKNTFFCGNFVCGTYTFGGSNSEWSQPERKPHNYFALNLNGVTSKMPQNNKCTHFCITNCHQRTKVLFDICFQMQINSVPCIWLFFYSIILGAKNLSKKCIWLCTLQIKFTFAGSNREMSLPPGLQNFA